MVSISSRCREILPEAIERVSSGGTMKYSIRNLFYATLEIYRKRFLNERFFKEYNSFTQDFMRSYEKRHGKLEGLVRYKRGNYNYPNEKGDSYEFDIKVDTDLYRGIGNKIIVVEKAGLYEMMKENKFDIRLDTLLMTTQGFTTEAGRELLLIAEQMNLPICILHDFDVNGVLINTTLTAPTKRLNSYLNDVIDLGLNWEIIEEIRKTRDLTPEPLRLSKQDKNKLEGLMDRGEISDEEYNFLQNGRIELNALTPLELLEWLEKRLEELDLWKTVPDQEELDDHIKDQIIEKLEYVRNDLVDDLVWTVKDELGLRLIEKSLEQIEEIIRDKIHEKVEGYMDEVEYPTIQLEEFIEDLRKDMLKYWTILANNKATKLAKDQAEPVKETVEAEQNAIIEETNQEPDIKTAEITLAGVCKEWIEQKNLM